MKLSQDVLKRMDYFKAYLLGCVGSNVRLNDLVKAVNKDLKQNVTVYAVIDTLRKLKASGIRGHDLIIGRNQTRIVRADVTVLDERLAQRADIKQKLGVALWENLFNIDLEGKKHNVKAEISHVGAFTRKLEALRRKTNVNIFIDAGSSTSTAVKELLAVDFVPIKVKELAGDGARLFRPCFITNSLAISNVVTQSRHYNSIQVRLVGGDVRVDRGSICGTLTELCMDTWNVRGDLAIIGATGYREDFAGTPCFGCDDIAEARLKVKMLELAWFRVLVLDSSKLKVPEIANVFAPLSNDLIDLVVTDDGCDIGAKDEVIRFKLEAQEVGVNTLILKTDLKRQ